MLTPARILISFVVAGAIPRAIGGQDPLVEFAGAAVPVVGFGRALFHAVKDAIAENGLPASSPGTTAAAGGIAQR